MEMPDTADTGDANTTYVHSILYVEDDVATLFAMSRILSRHYPNVRIDTAENGATGLELFRNMYHDLIITGNKMPVMNGMQMISEIRTLRSGTPVIFLTGAFTEDVACDAPMDETLHFMLKPVRLSELFGVIDGYLPDSDP